MKLLREYIRTCLSLRLVKNCGQFTPRTVADIKVLLALKAEKETPSKSAS